MSAQESDISYTIQPLLGVTKEAIDLLKITFYIDEPLNETINLCENGHCAELESYCTKALEEGLSLTANDKDGNIVGIIVNGIVNIKDKEPMNVDECPDPKFRKILKIIAKRQEGAKLWEKYPDDDVVLDVKIAATHPDWRNRGIMNALVKETEAVALSRKIRLVRLETSSEFSARTAVRFGFTCEYKQLYTDITENGEPLIVPQPPHLYDCVYIKQMY